LKHFRFLITLLVSFRVRESSTSVGALQMGHLKRSSP